MYEQLSKELTDKILADRQSGTPSSLAFNQEDALRRDCAHDKSTLLRPAFIRDCDKILNCPFYNRYADKTQVFSFCKNDDVTRRGLHVQLVSRIARSIGGALGLNCDLIEAIALGHDIGHTPFGHAGENYLNELLHESTGLYFSHNIHSVRVLDGIFNYNITLQTLCGIAAHDGEIEKSEYRPRAIKDFNEFDSIIKRCYEDKEEVKRLVPSTLEGCVVRIADIIAYLGKDRQDAERTGIINQSEFTNNAIGGFNAEIINNLIVNIVENSYGKNYIKLDKSHFDALKTAKADNYENIYIPAAHKLNLDITVKPMMRELFYAFAADIEKKNTASPVFTHHINYVNKAYYKQKTPYEKENPYMIAADYIAAMTDDYFTEVYAYMFPHSSLKIKYKGYFD